MYFACSAPCKKVTFYYTKLEHDRIGQVCYIASPGYHIITYVRPGTIAVCCNMQGNDGDVLQRDWPSVLREHADLGGKGVP